MRTLSWILLASAAVLPSHVLAEIGSVAAVNRDMEGTPPAAERRALNLGNRVVTDELIQTSPLGSGPVDVSRPDHTDGCPGIEHLAG